MTLFDLDSASATTVAAVPPVTALEVDFPALMIGRVAEQESWRKEVHRPATHTHKWWAQRLGSVFRGVLASAVTASADEAEGVYTSASRFENLVVFDPFAGSGTTLVEAAKFGAGVVGYDINPVATLVQRQAVAGWDSDGLAEAFNTVEKSSRAEIDEFHINHRGETVLYYFWVALAGCPDCDAEVELFSSHVFAKHAYAKKYPIARATCPSCHAVATIDLQSEDCIVCESCGGTVELAGPVTGQKMVCPSGHSNRVVDSLGGEIPAYRQYTKMVLGFDGSKRYEPIDDFDRSLYKRASAKLRACRTELVLPSGVLEDGYNTRQALRWGFESWEQFFNDRQLLSLGLLGRAVSELDCQPAHREALIALFSGVLEFNNLFCSFKGEGTGAVRHMFSHHVLKPERTPLEAHPWGTPSSSGSFSTLFKSRIERALEYKVSPHDIVLAGGEARRVFGLGEPLARRVVDTWPLDGCLQDEALIRCGSSSDTVLPSGSVDLIITDPPFMDNVHYSELADFFHAWLVPLEPFDGYPGTGSTRSGDEVQSVDAESFGRAIGAVWRECARVLRDDGLLAFTFHQSKIEGWLELVSALKEARFVVTSVQPVKAEMSTAAPKAGAREPSNLDSIVVCRKAATISEALLPRSVDDVSGRAVDRLNALVEGGITVGATDRRSVIWGSVLSMATYVGQTLTLTELESEARRAVARDGGDVGS